MKKSLAFGLAALTLAGCASSSGVYEIGSDTYRTSSTAITSFGGSAKAKEDAYRRATAYCATRGQRLELTDQKTDAQITAGSVDLTFRCRPA